MLADVAYDAIWRWQADAGKDQKLSYGYPTVVRPSRDGHEQRLQLGQLAQARYSFTAHAMSVDDACAMGAALYGGQTKRWLVPIWFLARPATWILDQWGSYFDTTSCPIRVGQWLCGYNGPRCLAIMVGSVATGVCGSAISAIDETLTGSVKAIPGLVCRMTGGEQLDGRGGATYLVRVQFESVAEQREL